MKMIYKCIVCGRETYLEYERCLDCGTEGTVQPIEGITAKEALRRIQFLKHSFFGSKEALHEKIDEIISKVK